MSLVIQDVVKTYSMEGEDVRALRGVSLEIEDNEYVAIMGPSGSGKSTLMNIIGCLDVPTEGSYLFDGIDVSTMKEDELAQVRNQKIGFVFQTFNLIPRASVFHNVELPLIYAGLSPSKRRKLADEAIAKVGLSDRVKHQRVMEYYRAVVALNRRPTDLPPDNRDGGGTMVTLYLPKAGGLPEEIPAEASVQPPRGHGETVLVIEDDADVRKLSVHMLDSLGYAVIDIGDAAAARQVLKNGQRAETNYIWPAAWFLSNYLRGYVRRIDLALSREGNIC